MRFVKDAHSNDLSVMHWLSQEHLLSGQAYEGGNPLCDREGVLWYASSARSSGAAETFPCLGLDVRPEHASHTQQKGTNSKEQIAKLVIAAGS